jgi:hypothetical protein
MYYISYYRKGGYPKPTSLILLEATAKEIEKIQELAPDIGLGIESIVELAKLSDDKLLIKVIGKWMLRKR